MSVLRAAFGAFWSLFRFGVMMGAAEADNDPDQPFQYASDYIGMPLLAVAGGAVGAATSRETAADRLPVRYAASLAGIITLAKLATDVTYGDRSVESLNNYEASTYYTMPLVAFFLLRGAPEALRVPGPKRAVAMAAFAGFLGTFAYDMSH